MKETHLWSKDYTRITIATVLEAIGGEAIMVPLSLMVFQETESTFLSAILLISGILPDVIIAPLISPIVERNDKRKILFICHLLMLLLYASMVIITRKGFVYAEYLIFSLTLACVSAVYQNAYNTLFIDCIPEGAEQKGYSISAMIYPLTILFMSPLCTFLFTRIDISIFFLATTIIELPNLLLIPSLSCSGSIRKDEKFSFKSYAEDLKDGVRFYREEKGIRNINTYIAISSAGSSSTKLLLQAFIQTNPLIGITSYGFIQAAEMAGRMFGGVLNYIKKIPASMRFTITVLVYTIYNISDMFLLFLPVGLMMVVSFIDGFSGQITATLRLNATMCYIKPEYRARANALQSITISLVYIVYQLVFGFLGEILDYQLTCMVIGAISLLAMYLLIVRGKKYTYPVYAAERKSVPSS